MPTVISGTTGVDKIQDNTVNSAKIVNASITAADLELEVIDEFTVLVTNPVTGAKDFITSKTGIDVGDITIDPETGTITY